MRHSLYAKFIVAYLIFGFLSFFVVATLSSDLTLNYLISKKAETLYQEATLLSTTYAEDYYQSLSASSLETVHEHLSAIDTYLEADIWMVDLEGNIILDSRKSLASLSPEKNVIENFDSTATGNTYYMVGDFFGEFREETLSVIAPVNYNYRVRGYVVIHTDLDTLITQREQLLNITYITLAIVLLLSLIVLLTITFFIYYPLKKISKAASEYAAGNLTYEIPFSSEDEIGQLAASMTYMAKELNDMEEYERKFVANISHDFRSPLTSIKGYVEAMLDGTIPPELQEKYLNIVVFETDRLTKLTTELLTLNSFDIKRGMLDISSFDINAVIKNTAAAFEGRCTERRISIELLFESRQLMVKADMGKIQQVLYNLLDNAIKFSGDDSAIYVETTIKHEKVFVSVKDSGIGIPKDSLKKVWERFYKTDPSRGKDKKGTGLGLAIVKEIIQNHGENINVISTEGVGTEFIFSLPRG